MGDGFEPEVQALARQIAAAGAIERVRLFPLRRWRERARGPAQTRCVRLRFRVRLCPAVGDLAAGMASLARRLLENTSNESFIRHRFVEGQALEALLAPPAVERRPEPSAAAERRATDPADPGPFANEPHAELRRPHVRAPLEASVVAAPARFGFEG